MQPKWTELTREVVDANPGAEGQVAIAMDNTVITAPVVREVLTGESAISGAFTRDEVEELSALIANGVLPVRLVITSVESVR